MHVPAGLPQDAGRAAAGAAVEEGGRALGRGRQLDRAVREWPRSPRPRSATRRSASRRTSSFYRERDRRGGAGPVAEEQRTTRLASGWTPIELLSHVLHMEQRWFVWGFLGEEVADPWGDWSRDEPWDGPRTGRSPAGRYRPTSRPSPGRRLRAVGERTTHGARASTTSTRCRRTRRAGDHTDGIPPCGGSASTCCRSTPGTPATSTSRSSWPADPERDAPGAAAIGERAAGVERRRRPR